MRQDEKEPIHFSRNNNSGTVRKEVLIKAMDTQRAEACREGDHGEGLAGKS